MVKATMALGQTGGLFTLFLVLKDSLIFVLVFFIPLVFLIPLIILIIIVTLMAFSGFYQ